MSNASKSASNDWMFRTAVNQLKIWLKETSKHHEYITGGISNADDQKQ